MRIVQATIEHLDLITPLFNEYRVFYNQASNLIAARKFIEERLGNKDSIIFFVLEGDKAIAFTQLYNSFTSVGMGKILILNDLYIRPEYRRKNIAKEILQFVSNFARENKIIKITLQTANNNIPAQKLYENFGYKRDEQFKYYEYKIV